MKKYEWVLARTNQEKGKDFIFEIESKLLIDKQYHKFFMFIMEQVVPHMEHEYNEIRNDNKTVVTYRTFSDIAMCNMLNEEIEKEDGGLSQMVTLFKDNDITFHYSVREIEKPLEIPSIYDVNTNTYIKFNQTT